MIDIEEQKKNFKDHVAKFYDCGTIKILDFQKPGSNYYRIRFLFEEDCYRLHISGDLGELTAKNATNMRYEKFAEDFSNNIGYFTQKIECQSRPIYEYDEDEARKQLIEKIRKYILDVGEDNEMEEWLNRMLADFDDERGISDSGYEALRELDSDAWEYAHNIGKVHTGILHLYMLAFKLAQEDLKRQEAEAPKSKSGWIPIEYRPGTEEEYAEFSKFGTCPRSEFKVYTNEMPEDGQDVLITTKWGTVCEDIYHDDVDASYFEDHDDPDDVIAWMPKPKGYVPEDKR